jgi:hypothetical protein
MPDTSDVKLEVTQPDALACGDANVISGFEDFELMGSAVGVLGTRLERMRTGAARRQ